MKYALHISILLCGDYMYQYEKENKHAMCVTTYKRWCLRTYLSAIIMSGVESNPTIKNISSIVFFV